LLKLFSGIDIASQYRPAVLDLLREERMRILIPLFLIAAIVAPVMAQGTAPAPAPATSSDTDQAPKKKEMKKKKKEMKKKGTEDKTGADTTAAPKTP
jgi:hypothetical protein